MFLRPVNFWSGHPRHKLLQVSTGPMRRVKTSHIIPLLPFLDRSHRDSQWLKCGPNKHSSFQNDKRRIFMVFKENPWTPRVLTSLTVFLSQIATFRWTVAGKIQLPGLAQPSAAPKNILTNLWHWEMINSDKKYLFVTKAWKSNYHHRLGVE